MDAERALALRWRIRLHGLLLLAGMAGLAALVGHLLLGPAWIPWLAALALLALVSVPRLSPVLVMRMAGAQPLAPVQAPDLYRIVRALAGRADLERAPALFYVPTDLPNAFAVGTSAGSGVAVTHGLLRRLAPDELVGVLAHELAHVRSGDTRVIGAFEEGLLRQVLGTRSWGHAPLRTHPRTEERVRDLLSLEERPIPEPLDLGAVLETLLAQLPGPRRRSLWLGP